MKGHYTKVKFHIILIEEGYHNTVRGILYQKYTSYNGGCKYLWKGADIVHVEIDTLWGDIISVGKNIVKESKGI